MMIPSRPGALLAFAEVLRKQECRKRQLNGGAGAGDDALAYWTLLRRCAYHGGDSGGRIRGVIMRYASVAALLLSGGLCSGANAQGAPSTAVVAISPQPPAVAIIEPVPQLNVLRAGTEIPLLTRQELTTKRKQLRVGQRFQMEVASAVTSGGVTVIPAGTPAVGEITEVRNKGMWGKSGYIGARVVSLRLGDRHVRLTGTFDDKGVTGTGGVVAAVAFVPIAGFFTTGTSAMIPSGSGVKAFLDEDIAFRAILAQPQVLEVPVPSPATVASAVSQTPTPGQ